MALNPIVFTEKVVRSFLRYQLTAYPFADERLHRQMRTLLSLDETRRSPLLRGPYVSLSRSFRRGAAVEQLVSEGILHAHVRRRIPDEIRHVYGHQEEAIRAIHAGRTTLVSTGTGSGKTECFLYPIVSRCLELKDDGAPPGICAVIVYPMNALAEDQLGRLRGILAGTGIPFGMYVGKTPERENEVAGIRLPAGSSRADYEAKLSEVRGEKRSESVYPPEEACSRDATSSSSRTRGSTSSSSTRPIPSPGRRARRPPASSAGCAASAGGTRRTRCASPPRPRSWTPGIPTPRATSPPGSSVCRGTISCGAKRRQLHAVVRRAPTRRDTTTPHVRDRGFQVDGG